MAPPFDSIKAKQLVLQASREAISRPHLKIGLNTLFDDLDLSDDELTALYEAIRQAGSTLTGFPKLTRNTFLRARTMGDLVKIIVKDSPKITIGTPKPKKGSKFVVGTIKNLRGTTVEEIIKHTEPSRPGKKRKAGSGQLKIDWDKIDLTLSQLGASKDKADPTPTEKREGTAKIAADSTAAAAGKAPEPITPAQQPAKAEAQPTAVEPTQETERRIGIWIGEADKPANRGLRIGQSYLLNFKVGAPVEGSLAEGEDTVVPPSDVPPGGLPTIWRVVAHDVELTAVGADTTAKATPIEDGTLCWSAQFDLLIPETGDSLVRQLNIKPLKADPRIDVIVMARGETYRQFKIALSASENPDVSQTNPSTIVSEQVFAPAMQVGVKFLHEWTTPSGRLDIKIIEGPRAWATGYVNGNDIFEPSCPWGMQAQVDGPLKNVRDAAEALRTKLQKHFDNIDADDLAARLSRWPASNKPPYWPAGPIEADQAHQDAWKEMAVSAELRLLAFHGRSLFDVFFPKTSKLRSLMEQLSPGTRLDIAWVAESGAGFVSHVPWGFMFLGDVPAEGQPIDPLKFLGMRCRVAYTCYQVPSSSRALGALKATHRAHFLYWGAGEKDATANEARWQRDLFKSWDNQIFVPNQGAQAAMPGAAAPTYRAELLKLLSKPEPSPTSLLYLFCQSDTETNNAPVLRFGETNDPGNLVQQMDFGTTALTDRPLIFANACGTASADTYQANLLEKTFFDRDCRAFLGTEIKVPIVLASRFAAIFFHFLYRKLDPAPIAAGEAAAQTRLFLWTQYCNLGGLFYCYINQYDLYVADTKEIEELRARL